MFFLQGSDKQWCPVQDHDGVPGPDGSQGTRALWPQGRDSFRRAVITVTLPEIDIALIGG